MKKKIFFLLITFLITSTMLYYKFESVNFVYTTTFNIANRSKMTITKDLMEDYKSYDESVRKRAEKVIKEVCLNNLGYENWKDYMDYIDINIYKSNILPSSGQELIVNLNLSKDLAVICIFTQEGQNYIFWNKIENLLPIEVIKFVKIPDKDYNFLVVYEINDERLGAYFYEKLIEIYMYKSNQFINIWKKNFYFEEIYKSSWIDERAPGNEWVKNIVHNKIDFIYDDNLKILVSGTRRKYLAFGNNDVPAASSFKLKSTSSYEDVYYWNKEFETFSMSENVLTFKGTSVVIVGDTKTDVRNIHGYSNEKYKLQTFSGKIIYIKKNSISKD